MNRPASPLSRWREIVHPIFWPVFFWNLRQFAKFLRLRIEAGGNGLISYDVTWWGGIRIFEMYNPDAPAWDAKLEGCAKRVHVATLDVFNPCLSTRAPLSHLGEGPGVRGRGLSWQRILSIEALIPLTPDPSPAGEGNALGGCQGVALAFGTFPNLPFLNTS